MKVAGLYPIRTNLASLNKARIHNAMFGVKAPVGVWHSKFGHPSSSAVHQILRDHTLPVIDPMQNKEFCEPCQHGKSKQFPFASSTIDSTTPLQLIHTNVWCSLVMSFSHLRYYVIFIDNYSRFSWLYPLHNKSDVFVSIVKFKELVEYQFSCHIKQLESDGGGEFL